jgi:hypothetical protein
VLSALRGREDRIVTLRARFTSTARADAQSHTTTGVLLVHKPDRFRLRLLLPIGLTVLDYLQVGGQTYVEHPLAHHAPVDDAAFSQADLAAAFLRGPDAFPGVCQPSRASDAVVVICRNAAGARLRELHVNAADATILHESSYDGDRVRVRIRYDDYRPVADLTLPFRIVMQYPGRAMTVEIAIQRYEVNPVLAAALFRPTES